MVNPALTLIESLKNVSAFLFTCVTRVACADKINVVARCTAFSIYARVWVAWLVIGNTWKKIKSNQCSNFSQVVYQNVFQFVQYVFPTDLF